MVGTIAKKLLKEKMLLVLIMMFVVMSFLSPVFLTSINLVNMLYQISIYGVIACGMTVAIICGDFDLSVGSVAALSGLMLVILDTKIGLVPAILVTLVAGCVIGLVNGLLGYKRRNQRFHCNTGCNDSILWPCAEIV